jgi:hypothetical protein
MNHQESVENSTLSNEHQSFDVRQAFFDFCRDQQSGDIDFAGDDSNMEELNPDRLLSEKPLAESNSVSSYIKGASRHGAGWHRPTLDLDIPCLLIESSTPGHFHLYIDKPMPWDAYEKLLNCLADVGILQQGFVDVSIKRKRTWLRTPWTRKVYADK